MTPREELAKAISLASETHMGQFDLAGMPYILHCLKVMHYLKTNDLLLMAIAVLHDVIEDSDGKVTRETLYAMGFSVRVVENVVLLTKKPGQTVREYLDALKTSMDAVLVKLADLRHNSDIRRLKGIREKDIERMRKYHSMYLELRELVKC